VVLTSLQGGDAQLFLRQSVPVNECVFSTAEQKNCCLLHGYM